MPEAERGLVHAAGAVLWRPAGGVAPGAEPAEVALVHRPRYGDWSLPKGKQAPGEHILLTATREVAEETGVRVTLGHRLASTSYNTTDGRRKLVDYWVARPLAGPGAPAVPLTPDEVDQVAWLPMAAARQRLSYARDVGVLDGFADGPRESVPVVFLRHANAMSRQHWRDAGHTDDLARPLSGHGRAQAAELAEVLACFPPARVLTSPARRCVDTVRGYAELVGAAVEEEPVFAVGGGQSLDGRAAADHSTAAKERVVEAVAGMAPVVVCAHGENLAWMVQVACERLGAPLPPGPPLRKGSFWVLHVAAGQLVCAEQHHVDGAHAPEPAGA